MDESQSVPDTFIGRKDKIAIYEQWLTDPHAPGILYFYDAASEPEEKGGVGKTWFLQRCRAITREKYQDIVIVNGDFFSIEDRNGRTLAERLYNQLLKETYPDVCAHAFDAVLKEEQALIKSGKSNIRQETMNNKLAEALRADLRQLDTYLHHQRNAPSCAVLFILDTFEVVQDHPSVAVLSPRQTFPDDYGFKHIRFLIAGRNAINWTQANWQGREQEVQSEPLSPFDPREMVDYMAFYGIVLDQEQAVILHELTKGRPILLGLTKDLINFNQEKLTDLLAVQPAEFEKNLVSRINSLQNPINWILLFMAHVYHHFNAELLKWLLQASYLQKLVKAKDERHLNALPDLSFVRRATNESGDFTLHDEMRRLIIDYCWDELDPDRSMRQAISSKMIQYCEEKLANAKHELEQQTYTIQILYHTLFLGIKKGFDYFRDCFTKAIDVWQNDYARNLLQEVHKFRDSLSADQRSELVMEEAQLLGKEGQRELELSHYEQLFDAAEEGWVEDYRAKILYAQGECLLSMTRFSEASEVLNEALQLAREQDKQKSIADILNSLGYIARRQGLFDSAKALYKESIEIYQSIEEQPEEQQEFADTLNNLGYVCNLLGKRDEAFIYCKKSLTIREALLKAHEGSEHAVAISYSTLGSIYLSAGNDTIATLYFDRAYDIFNRHGHRRGIAGCHNRWGQLQMRREELNEALKTFERASHEAEGADEEAQIAAVRGQGYVYIELAAYQQARGAFEQAIELARKAQDAYQEVDARIGLARVFSCQEETELFEPELERAVAIAQERHYNKFLGEIEKVRGDMLYRRKEYHRAFLAYASSNHFMAMYNYVEYQEARHSLMSQLLTLNDNADVTDALAALQTYWKDQELDTSFPELLQACDIVSEILVP